MRLENEAIYLHRFLVGLFVVVVTKTSQHIWRHIALGQQYAGAAVGPGLTGLILRPSIQTCMHTFVHTSSSTMVKVRDGGKKGYDQKKTGGIEEIGWFAAKSHIAKQRTINDLMRMQ